MTNLTPMLTQFFAMKQKYPDAVLFFRMGDFYEMFFEDAVLAAPILEIALTSRSKHQGRDIPMCGVPHHAVEIYINRLISRGIKVAVCDQVEDPKSAKGIVARDVTRVVTPGMVLSPDIDDPKTPRYMAAVIGRIESPEVIRHGLAALDVSTGEFLLTQLPDRESFITELARLAPAEVLVSDLDETGLREILENLHIYFTVFEGGAFDYSKARSVLAARFGEHALAGFGVLDLPLGVAAAGAALLYAQETQQGRPLVHVDRLRPYRLTDHMILDESTKRNLEILVNQRERTRSGSLLDLMDRTVTAMGGRRLKSWISAPLLDRGAVAERHEAVEALVLDGLSREDLRRCLGSIHDLERLTGRITLNRATPRDLVSLKTSLQVLPRIKHILAQQSEGLIQDLGSRLDLLTDVAELIDRALVESPPLSLKDGGLFKAGFHQDLDELMEIMAEGKGWIARLEQSENVRTGINSLKIGFNRVFGYYIEITRANQNLTPDDYIRKQTLSGAERYITPALKEYEEKVLTAGDRRAQLEQDLFEQLRQAVIVHASRLRETAGILAEVDVLTALAEAAVKYDMVRPELVPEDIIEIEGGRHPVIAHNLKGEPFVANDVSLNNDTDQVLII
ncbi:MAG: DNA mismatch repair protein MutS, partial [Deltaproteobacteria bacterium]|nr:DNA mismatch repair protein MutS [Deltaproteobacteria bacterium]